jgi:predicted small integral membrane protein
MTETRIVKIVMVGSLALFAGLVTFDNLIDYETNYAFVRHVLSMDTTPPGTRARPTENLARPIVRVDELGRAISQSCRFG